MFKIAALLWNSFWRALKSQPFKWRVASNPRRQSKYVEMKIQSSYETCAWIKWYMFSIQCEESRVNHFYSTSCSGNALRLLVLVAGILHWGLQVTSSFSIWGRISKSCFERCIFEGPNHVQRALKTSNFEHSPITKFWLLWWSWKVRCTDVAFGTLNRSFIHINMIMSRASFTTLSNWAWYPGYDKLGHKLCQSGRSRPGHRPGLSLSLSLPSTHNMWQRAVKKPTKRKMKRNINGFPGTCDVHSPFLFHVHVNMGVGAAS